MNISNGYAVLPMRKAKDGQLTNAAILLFGKRPQLASATSSFKIGRFRKDYKDLRFQDLMRPIFF